MCIIIRFLWLCKAHFRALCSLEQGLAVNRLFPFCSTSQSSEVFLSNASPTSSALISPLVFFDNPLKHSLLKSMFKKKKKHHKKPRIRKTRKSSLDETVLISFILHAWVPEHLPLEERQMGMAFFKAGKEEMLLREWSTACWYLQSSQTEDRARSKRPWK